MKKKPVKILITSVGATGAQNVIKAFRKLSEYKINIIGCDADNMNAGAYMVDKFYKIPLGNESGFVEAVCKVCKKENVNILIPIMEDELEIISKNKSKFLSFNPVLSDYKTIEICNNKQKCNEKIVELGIKAPKVFRSVKNATYPIIIKPLRGTGSKNIRIYKNKKEVIEKIDEDNFIIQEYIYGKEYTVDCFSSIDQSFIECVPRERIAVKGGLATKSRTVNRSDIISLSKKILKNLNIIGPSNIQFIEDQIGRLYFIEINPRFGGAYILSMQAGLNVPLFLLQELHKKQITYNGYKKNLLMLRYWEEIYI